MKEWKCKRGHIIGYIKEVNGTTQLMVLRTALDMNIEKPSEVDLLGPLSGSMNVTCSACGDVRPWVISVDALLDLFLRLENKKAFEFSVRLLEKGRGEA